MTEPRTSWWVGLSRDEFTEAQAREQARMGKSRFGAVDAMMATSLGEKPKLGRPKLPVTEEAID